MLWEVSLTEAMTHIYPMVCTCPWRPTHYSHIRIAASRHLRVRPKIFVRNFVKRQPSAVSHSYCRQVFGRDNISIEDASIMYNQEASYLQCA